MSLGLILAAAGALTSFIGNSKQEDAEKDRVRAERQAALGLKANTAATNAVYSQQADRTAEYYKNQAVDLKNYASTVNANADKFVGEVNALLQKQVKYQNLAADQSLKKSEAEYTQASLNNLRERRVVQAEAITLRGLAISGAYNAGAGEGSGSKAGRVDLGNVARRAGRDNYQNLSNLDQIMAANILYTEFMGQSNQAEADAKTAEYKFEAEQQSFQNLFQVTQAQTTSVFQDQQASLNKQLFSLADKGAGIETTRNIKTGKAGSKAFSGQSISSIGSSIGSLGANFSSQLDSIFTA